MRMGQGVRTGLGYGASSVSYRHNFLVISIFQYTVLLGYKKGVYSSKVTTNI